MTRRTTSKTVTFANPFRLSEFDEPFPAGRYSIETDEELLDEVSFPVYLRRATMTQVIADPRPPGITENAVIDPQELEEALKAAIAVGSNADASTVRRLIAPGAVDGQLAKTEP